jgi:hypothetical protein
MLSKKPIVDTLENHRPAEESGWQLFGFLWIPPDVPYQLNGVTPFYLGYEEMEGNSPGCLGRYLPLTWLI